MTSLLYALVGLAFWTALPGALFFALVLTTRICDAHQRGLDRIHHDSRRHR